MWSTDFKVEKRSDDGNGRDMESVLEAFRVLKKKSKMTWTLSSSSCGGSASGHRGLVLMDGASGWGGKAFPACQLFQSGNSSVDSKTQNCNHSRAQSHSQPECCVAHVWTIQVPGDWKGKRAITEGQQKKKKKNHEQALILQTSSLLYTFT